MISPQAIDLYVYRLAPASTVDAKPNSQSSRDDGDSESDIADDEPRVPSGQSTPGPAKDSAKRDAIAEYYAANPKATVAEVAEACGCGTSLVSTWRVENGLAGMPIGHKSPPVYTKG